MRTSISALTLLAAVVGLTGCADVTPPGTAPKTDYRDLYEAAFQTFVADTVEEKQRRGRTVLDLKADYPERLRRMTADIDRQAAALGIGSKTLPVTRSITRERVSTIVRQFPGKFNPDAYRSADPAQLFAEGLLFNGAALTYTDFSVGTPDQKTYERIYLAGTLLKADCGFFSCFDAPKDALSWQVVRQKVPFISGEPTLRKAELAAVNWDLTTARTLCRQGKSQAEAKKVEALIREYETLKTRILRSRAQTRANVAKWERIDRERKARSNQRASALFLQELQTVSSTLNDTVRQNAQNNLTTAIAMQNAQQMQSTSGSNNKAALPESSTDDRNAYLARLSAVRALKNAELEWKGLWEVIQADLMPLYNAREEGRSFRAQFERDTESAKKRLAEKKADFEALCDNERHEEALNRYLNANPDQYDTITINLRAEEKSAYAAKLKARYKAFYEKQQRLAGSLPD